MPRRRKSAQFDSTNAFIKNDRQQKVLDSELEDIEQLWYAALKQITSDKLEITTEWTKLMEAKRRVEYFDKDMDMNEIKQYTDVMLAQMRGIQKELRRNNFNFDTILMKTRKKEKPVSVPSANLILPPIQRQLSMQSLRSSRINRRATKSSTHSSTMSSATRSKHREDLPQSPLKESRLKSISDSNLHANSKYKDRSFTRNAHPAVLEREASLCFPSIGARAELMRGDDHRYLKHRMATTLVLPPVSEGGKRERKLSI